MNFLIIESCEKENNEEIIRDPAIEISSAQRSGISGYQLTVSIDLSDIDNFQNCGIVISKDSMKNAYDSVVYIDLISNEEMGNQYSLSYELENLEINQSFYIKGFINYDSKTVYSKTVRISTSTQKLIEIIFFGIPLPENDSSCYSVVLRSRYPLNTGNFSVKFNEFIDLVILSDLAEDHDTIENYWYYAANIEIPDYVLPGNYYVYVNIDHIKLIYTTPVNLYSGKWNNHNDYPGPEMSNRPFFSIGRYGYVFDATYPHDSFRRYDMETGTWSRLSGLPETIGAHCSGFSAGNKGYIIIMNDSVQLWEYEPVADKWSFISKRNKIAGENGYTLLPGSRGFILNGSIYFLLTMIYNDNNLMWMEFWQIDPAEKTWKRLNDFKGKPRWGATMFSVGSYGYLCFGQRMDPSFWSSYENLYDVWRYEPGSDDWMRLNDFPSTGGRFNATPVILNDKVYVIGGSIWKIGPAWTYNDCIRECWEYFPSTDGWVQKAPPPAEVSSGFAFGYDNYIIYGAGAVDDLENKSKKMFEFTP